MISQQELRESHDSAAKALFWHLGNPSSLTEDQFNEKFPGINQADLEVINRYLYVSGDGIVVPRSHSELRDWSQRYSAQVNANWNALGIANE